MWKMKESCANGEHPIQCSKRVTYHTRVFDMACVASYGYARTPFPSRPECLNVNRKLPF